MYNVWSNQDFCIHLNYHIRYVLAFLVQKTKTAVKIRLWFKDNPRFPNMSSDSFVYYLTSMSSAIFCRIINVYMTTLTTRRIIIVLSKLKIKTFLQQRYSLNYRRGILFAWKTRTSLHHFTKGGCSGTIEQIYPNHI